MNDSIEQVVVENQVNEELICVLCAGLHGNNTLCQMSGSDYHEIF